MATQTQTVHTTINYRLDPSQGGDPVNYPGTYQAYLRKFDTRPVTIQDIRGREDEFNLDVHGFQLKKHQSAETEFDDNERIKRIVHPEIEGLLKETSVPSSAFTKSRHSYRSTEMVPPKCTL